MATTKQQQTNAQVFHQLSLSKTWRFALNRGQQTIFRGSCFVAYHPNGHLNQQLLHQAVHSQAVTEAERGRFGKPRAKKEWPPTKQIEIKRRMKSYCFDLIRYLEKAIQTFEPQDTASHRILQETNSGVAKQPGSVRSQQAEMQATTDRVDDAPSSSIPPEKIIQPAVCKGENAGSEPYRFAPFKPPKPSRQVMH